MSDIYSFHEYTPQSNDIVMLDTSVYLAYMGHNTYGQNITNTNLNAKTECNSLIEKITKAQGAFAISLITKYEAQKVISKEKFEKEGCYNETDRKKLKDANPSKYNQIISEALTESEDMLRIFMKLPAVIDEVVGYIDDDILQQANKIQLSSELHGTEDALQLAIAMQLGATHFAALDADFKTANELNDLAVLLDSSSINK